MSSEREPAESERLAEAEPELRVQYLCEAAQGWHAAGAHERAAQLFERAVAAEGHALRDERAAYARFLVDVGETDRAATVLEQLWRSRDLDGSAYYDAGTLCEDGFGAPEAALRWYTSGIVRLAGPTGNGGADDAWIELLVGSRRSVRARLGEPTDEWDELWDTSVDNARQRENTASQAAEQHEDSLPRRRDGRPSRSVGRNDPCECGSGRKYKRCCGAPRAVT